MAINGLLSPFQRTVSTRATSFAAAVNPPVQSAVRGSSWLAEYLKKQAEKEAAQKAAEEEAAEQATFEAQKQAYKNDADFIYEGTESFWGGGTINPENGGPVNWFFDVDGGEAGGSWGSGHGDDVIYLEGNGFVVTNQGNDVVHIGDSIQDGPQEPDEGLWVNQEAWLGGGNDKAYGGKGTQLVRGGVGDDFIDLGEGFDIAEGGKGSDEFVIDLQNSGIDTIVDFVDTGDKITVLNGGEAAQSDDWYLKENFSFSGGIYAQYDVGKTQGFYEIRNADNDVAAIFGIGTRIDADSIQNYSVTASMNSSGIEIIESSLSNNNNLDFV